MQIHQAYFRFLSRMNIDSRAEYSTFDLNLKRIKETRLDWKLKDIWKERQAK